MQYYRHYRGIAQSHKKSEQKRLFDGIFFIPNFYSALAKLSLAPIFSSQLWFPL